MSIPYKEVGLFRTNAFLENFNFTKKYQLHNNHKSKLRATQVTWRPCSSNLYDLLVGVRLG